jgi:superoxide dismutase, Cu-Zn family
MIMKRLVVVAAVALAAGIGGGASAQERVAPGVARLQALGGSGVTGTVNFRQLRNAVGVSASIRGLRPGQHGFHIHERGDCSAPDGMSAGGHFNPTGQPHGNPQSGAHHAGDMPMLRANRRGNATLNTRLTAATLRAGDASIIGKAVIVHADPDDFTTQPTGNSGGRVACGVIEAAPARAPRRRS